MPSARRLLPLLLLFLAASLPAQAAHRPARPAGGVALASPDRQTTWPWGRIKDHEWRLDDRSGTLLLTVTYTNADLADRTEPRRDDDETFLFPDARYDAASGAFLAKPAGGGKPVVVARRGRGFFKSTELVPNGLGIVSRRGGELRAGLIVVPGRKSRGDLIEVARGGPFTLQSLIDPR